MDRLLAYFDRSGDGTVLIANNSDGDDLIDDYGIYHRDWPDEFIENTSGFEKVFKVWEGQLSDDSGIDLYEGKWRDLKPGEAEAALNDRDW